MDGINGIQQLGSDNRKDQDPLDWVELDPDPHNSGLELQFQGSFAIPATHNTYIERKYDLKSFSCFFFFL